MFSLDEMGQTNTKALIVHAGGCYRYLGIWVIRALAISGLVTILLIATPAVVWLMPHPAGFFDPPPGDTLVVLGAGTEGDLPDLETYWRCVYAARLFRSGSFKRIVLAGGPAVPGETPVAAVMAAYLEHANFPSDRILLETSSHSTRENAVYVRELLREVHPGKIVILTSDYHTRRAEAAFRHAGLDVVVAAVPYIVKLGSTPAYRPMLLELLLKEEAKQLWYRFKGWI